MSPATALRSERASSCVLSLGVALQLLHHIVQRGVRENGGVAGERPLELTTQVEHELTGLDGVETQVITQFLVWPDLIHGKARALGDPADGEVSNEVLTVSVAGGAATVGRLCMASDCPEWWRR